jgi:RND family efflux transporter MFP subunit
MSRAGSLGTLILALCAPGVCAAQQQPPAAIVAAPVVSEKVMPTQSFVGTVMPTRFVTIGSAVDGRVVERPFEEGDRVEAGQTLAQLLTDTISLEVVAAEAELQYREQQLAELKNGTRPEELAQAKARMESAAAREKFLTARRQRIERLYRNRTAATEDELEEAISLAAEAEQAHLEAQAAYDLAVAGPRDEVIAQADAQVAIQQAVVDRLQDQLQKHTVTARFPGFVVKEHTEVGHWLNRGDPVAEVAALDEVEIVVQVLERSIPYVHNGAEVEVEVPAIAVRPKFPGTVVTTVPQADVRARTFPVKVRVRNEITSDGPLLKSGMFARAALPVGAEQDALLVSKDAIVLGGPQPVVMVVDGATKPGDSGTARAVPVQLGVSKGRLIQVQGDLAIGALVVIQGNERLRPGQPVVVSKLEGTSETVQQTSRAAGNIQR